MQVKFFRNLVLFGLFIYLPFQSMAWGMLGHRIVGEVAEAHLNKKALKKVQDILGPETMAIASTWADFIKSDTSYRYLNNWHYLDFDEDMPYNSMLAFFQQDAGADVYTKINFLANELKDKKLPQDKKVFDLRMLIHLVGDVHQPMHVGHKADLGGNKIKVMWFGETSNLHRVWDEQIIESQELSYTEYTAAIDHPTKDEIKKWQSDSVSQWIFDTHQLSERIYSDVKPDQRLSYDYEYKYLSVVNDQLLKGGIRLAGLLNSIFG